MQNLYKRAMFTASIQDTLTRRLQALPEFVHAPSLRRDIDELVARHIAAGRIAVIDDMDTSQAYGDLVHKALSGRFEATHITLPRGTSATDEALAEIEQKSARADMLIAVGSGTISDLVKYTAHKAAKPYLLFPTAASMNGYVSATASISLHGHKQSLAATLPHAIFIDWQLIASAPTRLTQAGLGDSLARTTAQADWLMAHHLFDVAYDDTPYALIRDIEPQVLAQAEAIKRGDREAIQSLFTLLLLSGFGMTIAGSSVPASGAEHMLAHAYGMGLHPPARANLHGEEIAFTTLYAAERQQRLLTSPKPMLLAGAWESEMESFFGMAECAGFKPLYDKKRALMLERASDASMDSARWEAARAAVGEIHIPPAMLAITCKQAGLATHPEMLGWKADYFHAMAPYARMTRDRITCLDLA